VVDVLASEFEKLYDGILEAVEKCLYRSWLHPDSSEFLDPLDHKEINNQFQFLYKVRADSTNGFLTRASNQNSYGGLVVGSGPDVSSEKTRISQIISSYLLQSQPTITTRRDSRKKSKAASSEFFSGTIFATSHFVSPHSITQRILTDPDAIETYEIAHFYGKLNLMMHFEIGIDLQASEINLIKAEKKNVTFKDLDDLYKTLQRYVSGRDPYSKPSDTKSQFLLSYAASIGYLTQRFPIGKVTATEDSVEIAISKYKDGRELYVASNFEEFRKDLLFKTEFTKNKQFEELPTLAEISNRVFGLPIALFGITELLKGGLKQGAGEGTVSLIRGGAGSGKTSLAISIQRAVEAIGIPTVFVTSEETISAIEARRESVLSIAQKLHSQFKTTSDRYKILRAPSGNMKEAAETNFVGGESRREALFAILDGIIDGIAENEHWPSGATDFTKLFVVFDGVHNFLRDNSTEDDYDILKSFVEKCRDTGVQVLLTSSKDWMLDEGFEYLVDNYFTVHSDVVEEPVPYAERKFQIVKTRHQGSMIGNHRMTIGDEGELQFQPNFAELLKKQERRAIVDPDAERYSYPFRELDKEKYFSTRSVSVLNSLQNVKHFENCSTLIYGVGSASKTDLALRILANPAAQNNVDRRKRILVVSFLSSAKYYEDCVNRHNKMLSSRGFVDGGADLDVLYFAPGMVSPEEVYFKISSKIDHSETNLSSYVRDLLESHNCGLLLRVSSDGVH